MNRARIYASKVYHCSVAQGVSGFPKESVRAICSGLLFKRDGHHRRDAGPLGFPASSRLWRIDNGSLPEYQPRVSFGEACLFVVQNPYRYAYVTEGGAQ